MRDGLSLLDQVIGIWGVRPFRHQDLETLLGAVPFAGACGRSLVEAATEQNSPKALLVNRLAGSGHDVRAYCRPAGVRGEYVGRGGRPELSCGGWSKPPKTICHSWLRDAARFSRRAAARVICVCGRRRKTVCA